MEFWLQIAEGRIVQANFVTSGCGPSRASGSMTTELAIGKSLPEAARLEQQDVLQVLGGLPDESEHCALLAVNTLKAAIGDYHARQQTAQRCGECCDARSAHRSASCRLRR
jgi:nitrogen fixation NifU-like protein